jgi:hypothetical protein
LSREIEAEKLRGEFLFASLIDFNFAMLMRFNFADSVALNFNVEL